MPRLKPDTQHARREHILDAAELCFAKRGFAAATMQDICKEAGVSPGALYVYFKSKEDLIAGIVERDRAQLAEGLVEVGKAEDLVEALGRLARHYTIDEPRHKQQLVVEIGAQAMRDGGAAGEIFRSCDAFVLEQFETLFRKATAEGKIAPALDPATLAQLIAIIGDGLFWRRAVAPSFDAERILPPVLHLIAGLLNPQPTAAGVAHALSAGVDALPKKEVCP